METGNRYEAAITVIHEDEVRIIIRETFAHPDELRQGLLPRQHGRARRVTSDPYMKGSALRYDDEEESEELDEDTEEVEELDTSLPEYSAEPELEEELLEES